MGTREESNATKSSNTTSMNSAESGGDGSSNASEDNNNDYSARKKGSFNQMLADGATAQKNSATTYHTSVLGNPVGYMAGTNNLNIGMDLWHASSVVTKSGKMLPNPSRGPVRVMTDDSDQWIPDEREMKREKRKQSNRESARRSRLRKQADTLSSENRNLTDELLRLSEECGKLMFENNSIKEELVTLGDPDAVSEQENSTRCPDTPPCGDGC